MSYHIWNKRNNKLYGSIMEPALFFHMYKIYTRRKDCYKFTRRVRRRGINNFHNMSSISFFSSIQRTLSSSEFLFCNPSSTGKVGEEPGHQPKALSWERSKYSSYCTANPAVTTGSEVANWAQKWTGTPLCIPPPPDTDPSFCLTNFVLNRFLLCAWPLSPGLYLYSLLLVNKWK